jgi:hypothetical protein
MGEFTSYSTFDPASGAKTSPAFAPGVNSPAGSLKGEWYERWEPGNVETGDPHDEPAHVDTTDLTDRKVDEAPVPDNIVGERGLRSADADDIAQDGEFEKITEPFNSDDFGPIAENIILGDDDADDDGADDGGDDQSADCDCDDPDSDVCEDYCDEHDDEERGRDCGAVHDMRGLLGGVGIVPGPLSRSRL